MNKFTKNTPPVSLKTINIAFIFISFVLICMFPKSSLAQDTIVGNEQIDVIKPYLPTLSDAFKISSSPEKDTLSFHVPEFNYSVPTSRLPLNLTVIPVKAVKIKDDAPLPLSRGLIKAGYGNYNTPYFELFVNSLRTKNTLLSTNISHISSNNALLENAGYSDYSKNHVSMDGKWFSSSKEILESGIAYDRNAVHYYGFRRSDTLDVDKKQSLHLFNQLSFYASLKNNATKVKDTRHLLKLNYQYIGDNYKTNENKVDAAGSFSKNFDKYNLGADAKLNFSSISDKIKNNTRSVFAFAPFWEKSKADAYNFRAGINVVSSNDIFSRVRIFPDVSLTYHLAGNFLIAKAGIDGRVEQNSFQTFAAQNPFIDNSLIYLNSIHKINAYAGLQGMLSAEIPYSIKVSYKETDRTPFFVNSFDRYANKFMVIYDNMSYVEATAALEYFSRNSYSFQLSGTYFKYLSLSVLDKPYHRPDYNLTLSGFYKINERFTPRIHIKTHGKQYALIYDAKGLAISVPVKAWVDAALGLDYHYSSKLNFFLNLNNLLNQSNYLWYNFPSQRFNFLAGLKYSF